MGSMTMASASDLTIVVADVTRMAAIRSGCLCVRYLPITKTDVYSWRSALIGLMREAWSAGM